MSAAGEAGGRLRAGGLPGTNGVLVVIGRLVLVLLLVATQRAVEQHRNGCTEWPQQPGRGRTQGEVNGDRCPPDAPASRPAKSWGPNKVPSRQVIRAARADPTIATMATGQPQPLNQCQASVPSATPPNMPMIMKSASAPKNSDSAWLLTAALPSFDTVIVGTGAVSFQITAQTAPATAQMTTNRARKRSSRRREASHARPRDGPAPGGGPPASRAAGPGASGAVPTDSLTHAFPSLTMAGPDRPDGQSGPSCSGYTATEAGPSRALRSATSGCSFVTRRPSPTRSTVSD
ncbi:Hypothetical protein PFR_JS4_839 [Propionibacterium freudenreichii]|nr:Hypothetical protein PFR_JS4_839 [Propionibacterium freudenreichii]